MSQIEISCVGSTAVFTNTPNIFSGGNVDEVKFEFDKEWSNFTVRTAVFYTNPKETALQILDTNNIAKIPPNMLTKQGKLSIGVIGTNADGDVKASKILTYIIDKGAITDDMETTASTPDIWLQLLSIVKHNEDIVDDMNLLVDKSQLPNKANKDLSNVSIDDLHSKGVARIEFGNYVGTDKYGESYPNTLTFDFVPQFVAIRPADTASNCHANLVRGQTKCYVEGDADYATTRDIQIEWSEKGINWWAIYTSNYGTRTQLNRADTTYYYVAIG